MNIAILYICTGKYDVFWKDFYISCENNFLNTEKKDYYVFTDSEHIYAQENDHVNKIYQKTLGWPGNTLYRYHMFSRIKNKLKNYDYVFFFNANVKFMQQIGNDFLPNEEELLVVQHPGFFNKKNNKFTYERNSKSTAYIANGDGKVYICGGVNGASSATFLKLINVLKNNIDIDDKNNIVAVWHDESHINRYIIENKYKLLNPSYAYPEGWDIPFECKILIRDKVKYGGHNFLRDKSEKWNEKLIGKFKKIIKCVVRKV